MVIPRTMCSYLAGCKDTHMQDKASPNHKKAPLSQFVIYTTANVLLWQQWIQEWHGVFFLSFPSLHSGEEVDRSRDERIWELLLSTVTRLADSAGIQREREVETDVSSSLEDIGGKKLFQSYSETSRFLSLSGHSSGAVSLFVCKYYFSLFHHLKTKETTADKAIHRLH